MQAVIAVGVDLVDIDRFERVLRRSPRLAERVFTADERRECGGRASSLAARWAIKEAVAKALVDNRGHEWHDCRTTRGPMGEPVVELRGTVAHSARVRGITSWHVSVSHDGGIAVAFVVASGSVQQ